MPNNADVIRAATESGTDWGQLIATVAVVIAVVYGLRLLRTIAWNLKVIGEVLRVNNTAVAEVAREIRRR